MNAPLIPNLIITALIILIFFYLLVGVYLDIKTRQVPNSLNFGILLASIPLIYVNLENIGFFHFWYLATFFVAYLKGLGGADLKAIFPLIFIVPDALLFSSIIAIVGMFYMFLKYYAQKPHSWDNVSIPFFIPIFIGYSSTMFLGCVLC